MKVNAGLSGSEWKKNAAVTHVPSWQDGKPLEPVPAGWGADPLLPALQPAAAQRPPRARQGSQHPHRAWGDFRMAAASLCFSQETQMLFSILPCSRLGEAGMEQEKQHSAEGSSFQLCTSFGTNAGFFSIIYSVALRLMMTTPLFLKLREKQSLFRQLWASTAALWGLWLVGQVEPGC